MPVVGLPTAVEVVVSTLLTTQRLTSWKVAGENESTVLVLRFRQDGSQPCTASENSRGQWRRKPPSQLRRDQQRAQEHGQSGEHVSSTIPISKDDTTIAAPSDVLSQSCKSSRDVQPDASTAHPRNVTSDLPCTRTDLPPSQGDVLLPSTHKLTDTASTVDFVQVDCDREERSQGNDTSEKRSREVTIEDIQAAMDAFADRFANAMSEQCESLRVGISASHDALSVDFNDAETISCGSKVTNAPLSPLSKVEPHHNPLDKSSNSVFIPFPREDAASAVTVKKRANNEAESNKCRNRTVLCRSQPQRAARK